MTNEANYFFGELFRENLSPSRPYSPYWLIVMGGTGPLEVLTISWAGGEETLPVFSSEGEAHVFKKSAGLTSSWRTRETSAGELTSLLLGPYDGIEQVALDPIPQADGMLTLRLTSVGRKEFVELLTG